jgi:hypothetical protein
MLILDFLSWWYSAGFQKRLAQISRMLAKNADRFSFGLLLKSLFKPFRQIDADSSSGGGMNMMFQRLLGNFISRFVGFFARLVLIIVGLITTVLELILGLILIFYHLLLPVFPLAGIALFIIGWTPNVNL